MHKLRGGGGIAGLPQENIIQIPGLSRTFQDFPGLSRTFQDFPGLSRTFQDIFPVFPELWPALFQDTKYTYFLIFNWKLKEMLTLSL